MKDEQVELVVLGERPSVRDDESTELDVVVEVRCNVALDRATAGTGGGAMNLCLVVDRSGSMDGNKLETAKRSCIDIFNRLGERDLFTVVVFDNDAEVVVNPQTNRDEVASEIMKIRSRGMTNLSLGWYQGLLELQTHMAAEHRNRLFLLSDGAANQGETKKSSLAATAIRARDVGITTSTIGIGDDFQEDLLEAIASASGGRFWFIGDSGIEDILEDEFEGALTVLLDRPRAELFLPPGVRIDKELNSLRKVTQRYVIRPLQGTDVFNFALRLEIDPRQVDGDAFDVLCNLYDGELKVASATLRTEIRPLQEVVVTQSHPLVQSVVAQYEMSATDEMALSDMDAGNLAQMRQAFVEEISKLKQLQEDMDNAPNMAMRDRFLMEIAHLSGDLRVKEVTVTLAELTEPYLGDPMVSRFLSGMRKGMKHEAHRMGRREMRFRRGDDDALLLILADAIALADYLATVNPANAARIAELREKLRGYLERL